MIKIRQTDYKLYHGTDGDKVQYIIFGLKKVINWNTSQHTAVLSILQHHNHIVS